MPEDFACAPGPAGWRYTASRADGVHTDLTIDSTGRPYRLELSTVDWTIRGGAAGASLMWLRRGGSAAREHTADAHAFFGDSPAFWIALTRLAANQPRLRVVEFTGPALAARTVDLAVTTTPQDDTIRYDVTTMDTAERRTAYIAGELVLAADNIELLDLS